MNWFKYLWHCRIKKCCFAGYVEPLGVYEGDITKDPKWESYKEYLNKRYGLSLPTNTTLNTHKEK